MWTCCAGRAGTHIRSEALHRIMTIGRAEADQAGARPYHLTASLTHNLRLEGHHLRNALSTTGKRLQSKTTRCQLTFILDGSGNHDGGSRRQSTPGDGAANRLLRIKELKALAAEPKAVM